MIAAIIQCHGKYLAVRLGAVKLDYIIYKWRLSGEKLEASQLLEAAKEVILTKHLDSRRLSRAKLWKFDWAADIPAIKELT
ncbi:hypothetical protein [Shewanella sp. TC10]|uniref:hypothetical protein n=1 Tax=Shewanella sp. TC10 TaxID=1419739 RepID=UPI001E45B49C|nr:hypothetical protein [Shewanella sp. TC10]